MNLGSGPVSSGLSFPMYYSSPTGDASLFIQDQELFASFPLVNAAVATLLASRQA